MQGCRAGGAGRVETHEWRRVERGEPVSERRLALSTASETPMGRDTMVQCNRRHRLETAQGAREPSRARERPGPSRGAAEMPGEPNPGVR